MDASGSTPSAAPATVGLFGFWQTEPYTPQPVINGRIPKNAYNNVDLYRPSMLPSGAVHLTDSNLTRHLAPGLIDTLRAATVRLPSLKRLARKLDIDCAEAVVGFEYHGGRSVPTLDGVVVAEEHEEAMREAYCEQLFETMKKEADAREKEMVKRWETLVRKVVIGDRLKRKFGVTNEEQGKLTMEDHTSPSGKRVRI